MNRALQTLIIAMITFAPIGAHAVLIEAELTSDAYITVGDFDWAWAAPVAPDTDFAPYTFDNSFQSLFGWRVAETADFLRDGVTAASFGTAQDFACASSYFTNGSLCNYNDGVLRAVHNMPDPYTGGGENVWETWVVRQSSGQVPSPATVALFGIGLLGLGWSRRQKV